jgi:oligopeptidase B
MSGCQHQQSSGSDSPARPEPPVAEQRPHVLTAHGQERIDEYYWLRERESTEVLDYLHAENAYLDAVMADTAGLQETLYEEIRGRIDEDESSAPYRDGGYWYYRRYETGLEYPIYARRKGSMAAPEEVLLDVNALAEGQEFTSVRGVQVSPDHNMLAYAVDTVGRRLYTLRFKNLLTGETLPDAIDGVSPNPRWAADSRTVFYPFKDPETLRSYRIFRHELGATDDTLVFEEDDETYAVWLAGTKSRDFVQIVSQSTVATEVRLVDAHAPAMAPTVFNPRRRDHEYYLDHDGQDFYVYTNLDAKNFRLARAADASTPEDEWEDVIAHRDDVLLEDFELFEEFIALEEKCNGLTEVQIVDRASGERHYLDFGEAAYDAYLMDNIEYETVTLRYGYESMTTPDSVFDYDMAARERQLVKQDKVLGDFRAADYRIERLFVPVRDGVEVPVSMVYHVDTPRDGSAPLLQYAYGSYGYSIPPTFSYSRISLLDRGFIFAIAHVRGGSVLGRHWYEDGKLFNKQNTFNDFVDVSRWLIAERYTAPDRLYAFGGSAGGLLMGAVVNQAPELYNGVIAAVPFVDVVTTMMDESIPLTTGEYDEWGNPAEPDAFEYMLSYSPYDNVGAHDYPNMLVTTGLHDSQVQYWEPAKWVARLRRLKTDDNVLLMHTNMEAGHGGASGRFESIRETARDYAFLLMLEKLRGG